MSFWIDATSAMIINHCGDTTSNAIPRMLPFVVCKDNKLATAFDTNGIWAHDVNHTHYITLDLGRPHYITNIRGVLNITTNIRHVMFYVSNDPADFSVAVLNVDDWQAYSSDDSWEYQMNTPKVGRYVKIEVLSTTDADNHLRWG